MTVAVENLGPAALEIRVDGMLSRSDYSRFIPEAEKRIDEFGYVNLLINVAGLDGATAPALWEDLKFDVEHFHDVGRVAVVGRGESGKQQWLAKFSRPFTAADVEFFPAGDLPAAREWVRASREQSRPRLSEPRWD